MQKLDILWPHKLIKIQYRIKIKCKCKDINNNINNFLGSINFILDFLVELVDLKFNSKRFIKGRDKEAI